MEKNEKFWFVNISEYHYKTMGLISYILLLQNDSPQKGHKKPGAPLNTSERQIAFQTKSSLA